MFDPRITRLERFEPHTLDAVIHALPKGSMDEAIYENVKKRYARLEDAAIDRLEYWVDGLNVTGAFIRPAEITPGQHPILIFNRGGSSDYGMLVLPVMLRYCVPFAQSGYLTFASNYRGNDGGEGAEQFGGDDVRDLLELIDIARQHPGWDGKNIFMLGGSRGGMMTYNAIRQGAELNAAATFGGISDLSASNSNWPELVERFYARLPEPKPSMEAMIEERSAICWPQKLTGTPLLLMHGDADNVVEMTHSTRLATALEPLHADIKLVIYEGGNHSLSTHSAAMLEETKNWFERFTR